LERRHVAFICCIVAATACVFTWLLTTLYVGSNTAKTTELRLSEEKYDRISELLDLSDLEDIITKYYYKDVEEETLVNGALKGMVEALDDPYSVYYTEEEYKEYNDLNEGTYVGIGVSLAKDADTGDTVVVNVLEDSPAEKAGIMIGDILKSVDGVVIAGSEPSEIVEAIEGPVGTPVKLTVIHDGEERDVDIVRAELQRQFVYYTMYDNLCYVLIDKFHGEAAADFEKALKFAEDNSAEGLIVDVRNNRGGSVNECTKIADMLLGDSLIFYTVDREGNRTDHFSDAAHNELPLAVIVNGASASSSEILAGALQDNKRGYVVGTVTYGKGVVQSIVDMPYSGGGVKVTSSVYYTPNGTCINGTGITPDYEVNLPDEVLNGDEKLTFETDTQLQAAITYLDRQLQIAD